MRTTREQDMRDMQHLWNRQRMDADIGTQPLGSRVVAMAKLAAVMHMAEVASGTHHDAPSDETMVLARVGEVGPLSGGKSGPTPIRPCHKEPKQQSIPWKQQQWEGGEP